MARWDLMPGELQNAILDRLPPRLQHRVDRRNRDVALLRHFGREHRNGVSTIALSYVGEEVVATGLYFFLSALKESGFWCFADFALERQGIVIGGKLNAIKPLNLRFCNLKSAAVEDVLEGIEMLHGFMPDEPEFLHGVAIVVREPKPPGEGLHFETPGKRAV